MPSERRQALALLVALASDGLSVWAQLAPPAEIALDLATAALLFATLGFRWPFLPALVVEAIPGLALFPTWTLVVGAMTTLGARRPPVAESATKPPDDASRADPERDRT